MYILPDTEQCILNDGKTYPVACDDHELVLLAELRLCRVRRPNDIILHRRISETTSHRKHTVHTASEHEASGVGDALRLLLVAALVVVCQTHRLAATAEHTPSVAGVRTVQHATQALRLGVDLDDLRLLTIASCRGGRGIARRQERLFAVTILEPQEGGHGGTTRMQLAVRLFRALGEVPIDDMERLVQGVRY
jgi:hypothetical protein